MFLLHSAVFWLGTLLGTVVEVVVQTNVDELDHVHPHPIARQARQWWYRLW
jgi:hypothetical protein